MYRGAFLGTPLEPSFRPSLKLDSLEEGRPLGPYPDVVSKVSWPSRA